MSTLNAKLSDLRTFLHAPPSPELWKRLWHHLGTWRHQPGFAIACDYTSQVLATWPDALRCASEAELDDDDDPRWTLVRTLHLRGDRLDSSLLGKLQAITGIHLDQIAPAQRVLDPAQTPHLHTLHLRGAAWADTLPDLLRWRPWSRLDHLSLNRCGLHDRHLVPLLERTFPALTHLDLSSNPLTDRSARSLAETGPQRRQLRILNLGRTRITEVGIAAVLHGLTRLTALGLDGLDLPSTIWGEVVQSSLVGNHPRLDSLRDRHLGDVPIEMLARSPRLTRVRHLDLTGNDLTGRAIKALVESPYLHHLTTLALAHNAIDAPSVQMLLSASDTFPQLTHLDLTYNQTGD
ncbi:MAG: hypothetical protein AAFS10_27985, partial [Myxococcota bacterium]